MDNWSKKDISVGQRQAAFPSGTTIIELLVVTSIVAVLGVAFIPALQQGRAASSEVQCTANLKRLGLASVYYNNDYNQFIVLRAAPSAAPAGSQEVHQPGFKLLLLPYLNGGTPVIEFVASVFNPGPPPSFTPGGARLIQEVRNGAVTPGTPIIQPSLLLGNLNALRCPSNPNRLLASKDWVTPTSYSCNGAQANVVFASYGPNDRTPCATYTRMSQVTNPSKTWLVSEGLTDEGGDLGSMVGASRNSIDLAGGYQSTGVSMFLGHSDTTANFVFTDGHGAQLKPTQTANTTTNMWSITPSTVASNILIQSMIAHETAQADMW